MTFKANDHGWPIYALIIMVAIQLFLQVVAVRDGLPIGHPLFIWIYSLLLLGLISFFFVKFQFSVLDERLEFLITLFGMTIYRQRANRQEITEIDLLKGGSIPY